MSSVSHAMPCTCSLFPLFTLPLVLDSSVTFLQNAVSSIMAFLRGWLWMICASVRSFIERTAIKGCFDSRHFDEKARMTVHTVGVYTLQAIVFTSSLKMQLRFCKYGKRAATRAPRSCQAISRHLDLNLEMS